MRSRIVQDEPSSARRPHPPAGVRARRPPRRNIAARAAAWSANHRKLAIWGWLGIVFVLVATFMGGEVLEAEADLRRSTSSRVSPIRPSGR